MVLLEGGECCVVDDGGEGWVGGECDCCVVDCVWDGVVFDVVGVVGGWGDDELCDCGVYGVYGVECGLVWGLCEERWVDFLGFDDEWVLMILVVYVGFFELDGIKVERWLNGRYVCIVMEDLIWDL